MPTCGSTQEGAGAGMLRKGGLFTFMGGREVVGRRNINRLCGGQ